jgi:thiol-disulfide isomerase/thioredoxin
LNPAKVLLVTLLAGSLSIGIALYGERWLAERGDRPGPARGQHVTSLPDLRLPDLDGHAVASNSWAGKVVLLNYWATWCTPCLREMPMLAQLQRRFGDGELQVVGIAIDAPDMVRRFVDDNGVDYQILLGDTESIELSKRLGNRTSGLPFTVVFDAFGRRVFSQAGELSADQIRTHILPLLEAEAG